MQLFESVRIGTFIDQNGVFRDGVAHVQLLCVQISCGYAPQTFSTERNRRRLWIERAWIARYRW